MSSENIGIEQARKTLGDLVTRVQQTGTTITLTRNGKPAARIAPLDPAMTETAYLISAVTGDIVPGAELADPDGDIPEGLLDMPAVAEFAATQEYDAENPDQLMYLLRESDEGTVPRGFDYIEIQLPVRATPSFSDADAWADALDAEMKRTGRDAGDLIGFGYADGHLLGVPLLAEHPDADDELGVIVGAAPDGGTWTVRYVTQHGWWEAA